MCLILFSHQPEAERRLVLLANRDEYHARAAAQARFWANRPDILAGRDLEAGGTWLGLSKKGRMAAVTNYREPGNVVPDARSRGELPLGFLTGSDDAIAHAYAVAARGHDYNGFSLLLFDGQGMACVSNRSPQGVLVLQPGIYGLSNHLLDTAWPKVASGKAELAAALDAGQDLQSMLNILLDSGEAEDTELPDTGIGLDLERRLSARCIRGSNYGTRCATAVEVRGGAATFIEQTLVPADLNPDMVRFDLALSGL